jgi:hypothetical protein
MTTDVPHDLTADIRMCKDFRDLHAKTGMYEEVKALRTRLQFTLARYQDHALNLGLRGAAIRFDMQRLTLAAQQGFNALREAEDLLPPEEALFAARAAVDEAAKQLEMGVFHEMEEVGRDDLIEAAHRLASAAARTSRWRIDNEQHTE